MRHTQSYLLAATVLPLSGVLARTVARGNQCAVKGYDNGVNAYFYNDMGSYGTYQQCSAECLRDPLCKSFGVDVNQCMLFNVAVYGNFVADKDSPTSYYDRACISGSSGSAAVTTTTNRATSTPSATTTSTKPITSTTTSKTSSSLTTTAVKTRTTSSVVDTTTTNATSSTTLVKGAASTTTTKPTSSTTTTTTTKSTSANTSATSGSGSANTTTKAIATTTTITTITRKVSSTTTTTTGSGVPTDCGIPTSYEVTSFKWFNATHNLDCVTGPDLGDGTGCIKSDSSGNTVWCDPHTDTSCTDCGINVCSTGLPPQPLGYAPPDSVSFTFANRTGCSQLNPAVVHRYEVGNGFVNCGGSYDFMNFYGNSNAANSTGSVELNGYSTSCSDGYTYTPHYQVNFPIICTHDAQFNATCTTPSSFSVPMVSFAKDKTDDGDDDDDDDN